MLSHLVRCPIDVCLPSSSREATTHLPMTEVSQGNIIGVKP